MNQLYSVLFLSFFFFSHFTAQAAPTQYQGEATFKAETNMPGVAIEGSSKNFRTLQAEFSEDKLMLKKLEAELDAETLKTGIDLRDQHMFEKVFLVLSAKEKPSYLKLTMDKSDCLKDGKNLNCSGEGHFIFGKKIFNKKINLKFDENLNTQTSFNVSLKELALEIPSYLGIEVEDLVNVQVKASRK
jgi:hypothetical protein